MSLNRQTLVYRQTVDAEMLSDSRGPGQEYLMEQLRYTTPRPPAPRPARSDSIQQIG